jgi:hypothetical protein
MHNHSDPDLLLAAVLFLLTRYVLQGGRPELSRAVIDHLGQLAVHRDKLPPILSKAIPRLLQQWRGISSEQPPAHTPSISQCYIADDDTAVTANIIRFPTRRVRHG